MKTASNEHGSFPFDRTTESISKMTFQHEIYRLPPSTLIIPNQHTFNPIVKRSPKMSHPPPTPNLTLYTSQTPNGIKISITLAELSLPYKVVKIDMTTNEQKSPRFTAINPNGRIPALTDTLASDGKEIHIFESGSIMQYLIDTYDTNHKISYPRGSREAIEVTVRLLKISWKSFPQTGYVRLTSES